MGNIAEKLSPKNQSIEFNKPTLSKEELETVLDCLVDDMISSGLIKDRFEKDFKSTFKLRNVIAVNSVTAAYHLALISLGISDNDPVLLSTYAPHAALDAILMLRAKPIIVDLGKSSFHMDVEEFNHRVEEHLPKAILIDHTFGCLFDIKKYNTKDIPIIEDYSEAIGADSEDISVGKQGLISICGMQPNHVITTGNGAVVITPNDSLAETIRSQKVGHNEKREPNKPKYDYNLLDFQAAIGIEQISKLGVIIERKKKIAQIYLQSVLAASHETYFKNASQDQFNRFPVVIAKPYEEVERYFKSLQIGTERTISLPLHRILSASNSDFPNAERLYQRGHCIPIYPNLTKDNVNRIANSIKGLY
ncbi:MAG TPA: DegT/DnrJ/EryC1/StrS aminotransferase family protein [Leptospiraceae bacterium]|nr:DegT/DnrJ/EryC1/StrS aminotransferase family protein [Leptospiraceae bacterium]HMW05243.1 DegT/DnrJ/EryC1/StrS aminotransferase family protein [Leptospiraceae bacterium]HMX31292.1 DegT/DnrJ/EryC1/StrS aminotransferase family protein [Leptospiraceae bacterium]HMY32098.1 DegT/DnrJ/EryC1/StrS aminotransferase family protein [Leptospiraceae bacterium]HMZ64685.1 DegT/DnrJ/EryC1/StrS aminotransferase family protein [Leptospiraceae bacterium]